MQGRIQFVMQAHDVDNGSDPQLVATLYVDLDGLMPGSEFTSPIRVHSSLNYFNTMLSFRVVCTDENYCGKNCTTSCREQELL